MIWNSMFLMTIIDLIIIFVTLGSLRVLFKYKPYLINFNLVKGIASIVTGLLIIGIFYFTDLFIMWILPQLINQSSAMAAMEYLHLNYSWVVMLISVICIFGGFFFILKKLITDNIDLLQSKNNINNLNKELKNHRDHLEESEERFKSMVHSNWDGMIIHDKGKILDANSKAIDFLGYNSDELRQMNILELVAENSLESMKKNLSKVSHDLDKQNFIPQYTVVKKNKEHIIVETFGQSTIFNGKKVRAFVIKNITERKKTELDLKQKNELLNSVSQIQEDYISETDPTTVFDKHLKNLLSLTKSEYGFIGEIIHDSNSKPYLKTYAITNIAWNAETRKFYEENAPQGLEFFNLKTLFGKVITTRKPVISNNPYIDPRRGGLPEGHPNLNAFLGLPILSGKKIIGMIGISNRVGGYDDKIIEYLQPFIVTSGTLIEARRNNNQRKKIETDLNESEERFKSMVNSNWDGMIIHDKGKILDANSKAMDFFGYTIDELRKMNILELVAENSLEIMKKNLAMNSEDLDQQFFIPQYTIVKKNKEQIPVKSFGQSTIYNGKKVRACVIKNITERVNTEKELEDYRKNLEKIVEERTIELKESKDKLSSIVKNVVNGIITIDEKGIIESFNNAAEIIFGYREKEVINKNISILMFSPERDNHDSYINNYLSSGIKKIIGLTRELKGIKKDGTEILIELSVTELLMNNKRSFVGVVNDITERVLRENELRENEEKFRSVTSSALEAIIMINSENRITLWNPSAENIFGWKMNEVLGQKLDELILPARYKELHKIGVKKFCL